MYVYRFKNSNNHGTFLEKLVNTDANSAHLRSFCSIYVIFF